MATPGKAKKKESKRQFPAKSSIDTPFLNKWKVLPHNDMCAIHQTIKLKLECMELQKIETKVFRKFKRRKNKKRPPVTPECDAPEESHSANVPISPNNGWTNKSARGQLAVGINEVTKALEKNELRLMLVCKSVKPQHMTDHLIALSVSRGVPACQVPQLSRIVSELLRLKSVLALGFRRCNSTEEDYFAEIVGDIIPRVPPLHIAWLQGTGAASGADEELLNNNKRGPKRKLEDEREISECDVTQTEVPEAVSGTLQPLRVKRIVNRPNKKTRKRIKK